MELGSSSERTIRSVRPKSLNVEKTTMKTRAAYAAARVLLIAGFTMASVSGTAAAAAPKVALCHFPPGNPTNAQLLTVAPSAVAAHVAHHNDAVCASGAGDCCFGGSAASRCTDFATDASNCGACGHVCTDGAICTDGSCVSSCAAGTIPCGADCVDASTDSNNCGACGNVCAPGTTCSAGTCTCPAGTTLCSGACLDTGTDEGNCGACGTVCASGATCTAGACECPAGTTLCNGACVDTDTDEGNCGACGTVCASGASCTAGTCECPAGTTLCNGACVDTGTDPSNCGACDHACASGATCSAGACNDTCPTGTTPCGGVCVNTGTDPDNCGACGTTCATGTTCAGGACQSICAPGTALCGGVCVNENTDPSHCGSCGTVCGPGTTCTGGSCVSADVAGSCLPSSSLGVLIQGNTVTAYVPLGSWSETMTGVVAVQLEPTVGAPSTIATTGPVNACSSNGSTGLTVCTGNTNDVYVLDGTALLTTLTAGGTGEQTFSGGTCVSCGVATDAGTGLAWLAEGTSLGSGQLQSLEPVAPTFGAPLDLFGKLTSENISIDPVRHLILSAVETGDFQIVNTLTGAVFDSAVNYALELNATAEDCSTGIAVAPGEFSASMVIVDLSQAVYTPGAPGTWSAPAATQDFSPDFLSFTAAGLSGVAVAPGSHLAGVTDEFGGAAFGVVQLPAVSGSGTPSAVDFVAASMPDNPLGPWNMGLDPHTITAYTSPSTGKALLAISNVERTFLALVDMQALLAAPRTAGTHTVDPTVDLVGSGIVTFVAE